MEPRFVDLLAPLRAFAYYHPAQNGSASLKAVLPELTGRSYEGLEIADGGTASLKFLEMAFTDMAEADGATIARQLEIYCAQDTSAMLDILKALESIIRQKQLPPHDQSKVVSTNLRGLCAWKFWRMFMVTGETSGSATILLYVLVPSCKAV